ncbi:MULTISPECIES: stage III sporulation protein AG [Clostridium]|uniref:Stage III sporulation protein AG n=1 Tax=Clostridium senegalense TaxID=1465809 RepID=A0A6M0H065_9CLOT|nr:MULTISPECIES: stage III sporulation protein AG [Clostridium]NEU03578.1 stage III sporulation protein AG [Clostridium senegalense]
MDFEKIKAKFFSESKENGINQQCIGKDNNKDENKNGNKSKGKMYNLLILFFIGVALLFMGNFFKQNSQGEIMGDKNSSDITATVQEENKEEITEATMETSNYKEKVQGELISILEKIDGVGRVEAMIYFESGEEQVPALNINDSKSNTTEKDTVGGERSINQENGGSTVVMSNEGSKTEPLIVKTYNPKITGICVVAEGASDKITELRVRQAVTNLFDLEEEKVQVYPMKN